MDCCACDKFGPPVEGYGNCPCGCHGKPYERSMSKQMRLAHEVAKELTRAQSLFPAINTPHEGLAVVWEEFEEFKDEVFAFNVAKGRDTRPKMRTELIQLASMALRTIYDCIDAPEQK